jgi:mono/diheme cytochrome c family protein
MEKPMLCKYRCLFSVRSGATSAFSTTASESASATRQRTEKRHRYSSLSSRESKKRSSFTRRTLPLAALVIAVAATGCQQRMADQPSYKPLRTCEFFADGRSDRPLVAGTVARGHLRTDTALFTGRRAGTRVEREGATVGTRAELQAKKQPDPAAKPVDLKTLYAEFTDTFPLPITAEVLEHGYHRYTIYCVVCHDPLGEGRGKIVERGYTPPPSYHIERLREAPVGHLFAVVSQGYGSMPAYEAQIPVRDRWAIVAYLRALQLSQHFPESRLSDEMRRQRAEQVKTTAKAGAPK